MFVRGFFETNSVMLDGTISGESMALKRLHSFLSQPRQNSWQFEFTLRKYLLNSLILWYFHKSIVCVPIIWVKF